jgi:hypothetical protein
MFGKKKPKSDNKQMERKIEHKTGGKGNAETETRFYVFIKVASYEYLFSSFFLASFYPRMTMYKTVRVKF